MLVGALVGLFGQGMAFASAPVPQSATMVTPTSDCMEAMQDDPNGEPCKGLTLDCIAAMGCVVPFTLTNELPALPAPALRPTLQLASLVDRLNGRVLSPEPEPPAL